MRASEISDLSDFEDPSDSFLSQNSNSMREPGLNPNALLFSPEKIGNLTPAKNNDQDSPYSILKNLRLKNVNRIIIGHININSIRNKIHLLAELIKDKVDILLISETKIDCTFPTSQFTLQGYSTPYRLDRTANGGGLLLYLRNDIPTKPLSLIESNIECIISDVTISKKKWLLVGTYNPNKSQISNHLVALGKNLGHYLPHFDNIIIFGDFNSEIGEDALFDKRSNLL